MVNAGMKKYKNNPTRPVIEFFMVRRLIVTMDFRKLKFVGQYTNMQGVWINNKKIEMLRQ